MRRTLLLATAALLLAGCEHPAAPPSPGAAPADGGEAPSAVDLDEADDPAALIERATSAEAGPDARAAACAALAAHGESPLVIPTLYQRLADDDELETVKLAAVESLTAIGTPAARKMVHAYFYGRPGRVESWMVAGDWLVDALGPHQVVADLEGMANREDYDLVLVRTFAERHPDHPPLQALADALQR